uniref:Uncharacterized protein n=1 Tax=Moniliophthora roreri TaxID=221103 RepID=A0A0W0FC51_MONRR
MMVGYFLGLNTAQLAIREFL